MYALYTSALLVAAAVNRTEDGEKEGGSNHVHHSPLVIGAWRRAIVDN